jgi:hypothetical protein
VGWSEKEEGGGVGTHVGGIPVERQGSDCRGGQHSRHNEQHRGALLCPEESGIQHPVGATIHQGDDDRKDDAAQVEGEPLEALGDQAAAQHKALLGGSDGGLQCQQSRVSINV